MTTDPTIHVQTLDSVREELKRQKGIKGATWRKIAAQPQYSEPHQIPPGTLASIAAGREPKGAATRIQLGLPALVPAPACKICGLVHIKPSCPTQRKKTEKKMDYEHQEQVALMQWVYLMINSGRYPELDLLFAIPNLGSRSAVEGKKKKAEGRKKGVPDLCLPVARSPWHALYIELKAVYPDGTKNSTSPEQKEWIRKLAAAGNYVAVAWGWEQAKEYIEAYLSLSKP